MGGPSEVRDDGERAFEDVGEDIDRTNLALSQWAARSAMESEALIERFEAMGYAVRGKSEDEIAEVLRHPPGGRR